MLAEATIILQDVQHSREPREDQYLISVFLRPLDQLIDKDHFARTLDQMFAQFRRIDRLLSCEEVRVVADFAELDEDVLVVCD